MQETSRFVCSSVHKIKTVNVLLARSRSEKQMELQKACSSLKGLLFAPLRELCKCFRLWRAAGGNLTIKEMADTVVDVGGTEILQSFCPRMSLVRYCIGTSYKILPYEYTQQTFKIAKSRPKLLIDLRITQSRLQQSRLKSRNLKSVSNIKNISSNVSADVFHSNGAFIFQRPTLINY